MCLRLHGLCLLCCLVVVLVCNGMLDNDGKMENVHMFYGQVEGKWAVSDYVGESPCVSVSLG